MTYKDQYIRKEYAILEDYILELEVEDEKGTKKVE